MKVLAATINYDHPQRGMLHALRGIFGETNVVDFDYLTLSKQHGAESTNTQLVATARAFQPDWVWLQLQDTGVITPAALGQVRAACPQAVLTHWTGDARPHVSPYLGSICKAADLTLTSAAGLIPRFQAAGAKHAEYLQIGVDWEEDVQGLPAWEPPFRVPSVVFCGSYYGSTFAEGTRDREQAIRALQAAKIDVGIVGTGWPRNYPVVGRCDVKQQVHVYRRAQVALNVNHFNGLTSYYSDRQLIAMVSGTPLVCHYMPELEREFQNGLHCLWYRTEAELVEAVQKLLADPARGRDMGRAARAEIIRNHTWFTRVLSVLPRVEALRADTTRRG